MVVMSSMCEFCYMVFFFTDTASTEIYTYLYPLSLHDALPISPAREVLCPTMPHLLDHPRQSQRTGLSPPIVSRAPPSIGGTAKRSAPFTDRKSTRLNSSH